MFRGEFEGLNAMQGTGTVGVPRAFHYDDLFGQETGSWILMEHIAMSSAMDQADLGLLLGQMHMAEPLQEEAKEGNFGFQCDNTIGATPQPNGWMDDWIAFYRDRRLMHQVGSAQSTSAPLSSRQC